MAPKVEDPQREICHCFHVPLGKLVKFHRLRHPRLSSQFSECFGAGTGCGWCVPFLEKLYEQLQRGQEPRIALSPEEYARRRAEYRKGRTPDETITAGDLAETRRVVVEHPRKPDDCEEG